MPRYVGQVENKQLGRCNTQKALGGTSYWGGERTAIARGSLSFKVFPERSTPNLEMRTYQYNAPGNTITHAGVRRRTDGRRGVDFGVFGSTPSMLRFEVSFLCLREERVLDG